MGNWLKGKSIGLFITMLNYEPLNNIMIPMFDIMAGLIGAVPTPASSTSVTQISGTSKSIIEINKDSAEEWVRINDNVMGGKSTSSFSVKEEDDTYFIDYKGMINTHGGGFTTLKAVQEAPMDLSSFDGICVMMRTPKTSVYQFYLHD